MHLRRMAGYYRWRAAGSPSRAERNVAQTRGCLWLLAAVMLLPVALMMIGLVMVVPGLALVLLGLWIVRALARRARKSAYAPQMAAAPAPARKIEERQVTWNC